MRRRWRTLVAADDIDRRDPANFRENPSILQPKRRTLVASRNPSVVVIKTSVNYYYYYSVVFNRVVFYFRPGFRLSIPIKFPVLFEQRDKVDVYA